MNSAGLRTTSHSLETHEASGYFQYPENSRRRGTGLGRCFRSAAEEALEKFVECVRLRAKGSENDVLEKADGILEMVGQGRGDFLLKLSKTTGTAFTRNSARYWRSRTSTSRGYLPSLLFSPKRSLLTRKLSASEAISPSSKLCSIPMRLSAESWISSFRK